MLSVDHASRTVFVISPGNLTNPIGGGAGALGDCAGSLAMRQQPQDLPPRPFVGLFGCPVALPQLVRAEIVSEMNVVCHARTIQHPTRNPYQEIARTLVISLETVKKHVSNLISKLAATSHT